MCLLLLEELDLLVELLYLAVSLLHLLDVFWSLIFSTCKGLFKEVGFHFHLVHFLLLLVLLVSQRHDLLPELRIFSLNQLKLLLIE